MCARGAQEVAAEVALFTAVNILARIKCQPNLNEEDDYRPECILPQLGGMSDYEQIFE
jgi:hypothetical protein